MFFSFLSDVRELLFGLDLSMYDTTLTDSYVPYYDVGNTSSCLYVRVCMCVRACVGLRCSGNRVYLCAYMDVTVHVPA